MRCALVLLLGGVLLLCACSDGAKGGNTTTPAAQTSELVASVAVNAVGTPPPQAGTATATPDPSVYKYGVDSFTLGPQEGIRGDAVFEVPAGAQLVELSYTVDFSEPLFWRK